MESRSTQKAIFVFDGHKLPCKSLTSNKREQKRDYYLGRAEKSEPGENTDQNAIFERYSKTIQDELFYKVMDFLIYRKQEIIVAPYESDSQLAYLYHNKIVDIVVSEDSDMFAYGIRQVIREIRTSGDCLYMDLDNLLTKEGVVHDILALCKLISSPKPIDSLHFVRMWLPR